MYVGTFDVGVFGACEVDGVGNVTVCRVKKDRASFNPKYAIGITELAKVIAPWAFTNNHQLTYGLTSNSLQTPTAQALSLISIILLHNLGLMILERFLMSPLSMRARDRVELEKEKVNITCRERSIFLLC